ncbi:helix-turn-helix domain-containing protein (plasmid) [Streptomyces castrisilvae]|uniref:Helix-turn-helix domain-containing protein n=1 Tax=Streptomyces castrisilvae TaxID=3033811 RepID=A0ABY9HVD0_9ACTN|nr:helix-turn-helix domain-containing protein [Streptomyces sp. Mut1]WLQ38510.1 helix-turn-helix domain-containing protein [Streptomyces sp. Mut1]
MLRQPAFGSRLKKIRLARGLSQTALAGEGMSTGYLSRLESGGRQPTERAVAYLAERLGLQPSEFEEPAAGSLAHALTLATSTGSGTAIDVLREAYAAESHEAPALRWQALWLLAQSHRLKGDHVGERAHLEDLVRLGDEVALPELRVRGLTRLARCLRSVGEIQAALVMSEDAHRLACEADLGVEDRAAVLLALASVETEAGRLPDARVHADELAELVEGRSDTLWAEALWTVAAVRVRQGDHAGAQHILELALAGFSSAVDLTLWVRLRIAAGRLYLQRSPADPAAAERRITEAEAALVFVRTEALDQEMAGLKADLAFVTGRYDDARTLLAGLARDELMTYRDRVRFDVLRYQLSVLEGDESGVQGLGALAEEAQASGNIDLAAEIWRILAEALTQLRAAPVLPSPRLVQEPDSA